MTRVLAYTVAIATSVLVFYFWEETRFLLHEEGPFFLIAAGNAVIAAGIGLASHVGGPRPSLRLVAEIGVFTMTLALLLLVQSGTGRPRDIDNCWRTPGTFAEPASASVPAP